MILNCNSCKKKFVVPDKAITVSGRTVQCGSCGNKWKQFPIENVTRKVETDKKINIRKQVSIAKTPKLRKKKVKTAREINLYSPEYLAKKHGIHLENLKDNNVKKSTGKITFGFYNSLIVFIVIIVAFSRSLYFFQDMIFQLMPLSEFYLNYFFESIKNIFEIIKNLIFSY